MENRNHDKVFLSVKSEKEATKQVKDNFETLIE